MASDSGVQGKFEGFGISISKLTIDEGFAAFLEACIGSNFEEKTEK